MSDSSPVDEVIVGPLLQVIVSLGFRLCGLRRGRFQLCQQRIHVVIGPLACRLRCRFIIQSRQKRIEIVVPCGRVIPAVTAVVAVGAACSDDKHEREQQPSSTKKPLPVPWVELLLELSWEASLS